MTTLHIAGCSDSGMTLCATYSGITPIRREKDSYVGNAVSNLCCMNTHHGEDRPIPSLPSSDVRSVLSLSCKYTALLRILNEECAMHSIVHIVSGLLAVPQRVLRCRTAAAA